MRSADVCELLEDNGVKVYPLCIANDEFFGLSVAKDDGGPAVVVNVWERISVERWIFTAAHDWATCCCILAAIASTTATRTRPRRGSGQIRRLLPDARRGVRGGVARDRGLSFVEAGGSRSNGCSGSAPDRASSRAGHHPLGKAVWGRFQAEYKAQYGAPWPSPRSHWA